MSGSVPEPAGLRERRENTVAALCEHFSQDRLTLEQFETRLDLAHKAVTLAQLEQLVADIAPAAATRAGPAHQARPAAHADDTRVIFSVMGGAERRGNWRPGARNTVLCVMGGALLDFRETPLPPGVTEVFILACMGGCEIIVPPDLAVETHGFALMGGFGHYADSPPPPPGSPVLRISGVALMGGVDVTVRLPGETARDAKRRLKEVRRMRDGR